MQILNLGKNISEGSVMYLKKISFAVTKESIFCDRIKMNGID